MKQLRDHMKNRTFSQIYLFTGEEKYLIDVYRERMVKTIFDGQDAMMNFDQFNQDNKDIDKIESSLETLPFFADKRVVLLENLDLFNAKNKSRNERITNALKNLPESTICIIIDDKIDKRSRLYKLTKDKGHIAEFGFLSEKELIQYIARELKKVNMNISTGDARYLVDTVGYELRSIAKEVSKLIDYMGHDQVVTKAAIDDVCTKHLEAKIFELVDALGLRKRERALNLYQDMVTLKEPTSRILFMISRQYTLIFETKLLSEKRMRSHQIASQIKVPEFVARKLIEQSRSFEVSDIKRTIKELVELEYDSRTGNIQLETGLELFILRITK